MVLMMRKHLLTFFVLLIWMASPASGQNRLLKYADKQFGLENYAHAASVYAQAYQQKPRYTTAKQAAQAYTNIQDYDQSFAWWEKVVTAEEAQRDDYAQYLQAALKVGKGDQIEKILTQAGLSPTDFPELDFALINSLQSGNARVALLPLQEINTPGSDFGLVVGNGGNQYFSSDRGEPIPTAKKGIRLDARSNVHRADQSSFNDRPFFQIYQKDETGNQIQVKSDLQDAAHVSDIALMPSKGLVFYTVLRDVRKIKKNRAYSIHPEIFYGILGNDGSIQSSKAFPLNEFTNHGIQNPFVDESTKRIYFASDMAGGTGGFDIYYVTYDENLNFGSPVNLGPVINTAGDESHPFIVGDTFFFSSKGHPGVGGMDIFRARISEGAFTKVQNLGIPFNSTRDDFAYYVSKEGKRYLSSDREGGLGLDDIYLVEDLYKKLLAKIIDCDGVIVSGDFDVQLVAATSKQRLETQRSESGEILGDLEPEQDFWLLLSKPGYFSIQDSSLSTIGLEADTLKREYRLTRIPYNLPMWTDILFYDLDKSGINADAQAVLDRVAELMGKHDFLSLKVGSHTDARASVAYNMALSERRTNAVMEYLSDKGIAADRIQLGWFGEEKLANDCGDGRPCPENLHQQNRRSELVLEAFANKTKTYQLPEGVELEDPCDIESLNNFMTKDLLSVPNIYFDFDKHNIRPQHKKELDRVSFMMKQMDHLQLYLAGHTDQRGNEAYNMKLAEKRAKAVMDYLVTNGVDANRLKYEWFGKSKPVQDCQSKNCSEAMHQENRRTELQLKGN